MSRFPFRLLIPLAWVACLATPAAAQLVENGPWIGALTDNSAEVHLILAQARFTDLEVSKSRDFGWIEARARGVRDRSGPTGLTTYHISHLEPDTTYYCRVVAGRQRESRSIARFRTLPSEGEPTSFRFAFASNHATASEAGAFSEILYQEPRFFLHLGNAISAGDAPDNTTDWQLLYESYFESFTQAELYREVPLVYTWGERDYAGPPTHEAYRQIFPHYPLGITDDANDTPIAQAFTVGRCRFLVLDTETARSASGDDSTTVLGDDQWQWLQDELTTAATDHALIFLASALPWNAPSEAKTGLPHWGNYPAEREQIAAWLAAEGITNVIVLSGNSGELATLTSADQIGQLPEFTAGAIDVHSEYVEGTWDQDPVLPTETEELFGIVEVEDLRERIVVKFLGLNQHGHNRVEAQLTFDTP